jgi:hypothetical protein
MKMQMLLIAAAAIIAGCEDAAITVETAATASTPVKDDIELYIDVHNLEPGKVTFDAVMDAHRKDLATQGKYGVQFHKFWVDEEKGKVYCLSSAANAEAVSNTHKEAHGLLPISVHQVRDGVEDPAVGNKQYFLDVHQLGAGKVTAGDVADAHKKDLAVQAKHGVNFVNYWVDEKEGLVLCLSQASEASKVVETHKEAHGLIPAFTLKVKQGE